MNILGGKKYVLSGFYKIIRLSFISMTAVSLFVVSQPASALTFPLYPLDNTAPTTPTGITAAPQASSLQVSWSASTDNVGVTGYEVWRNGVNYASTTKLTYTDNAVVPGQTYTYAVKARDASGNYSPLSSSSNGTTAQTTVWGNSFPAVVDGGDANSIEVGMKFIPKYDGVISGVRFYKAAGNTGTHVGNIWTTGGVNMGSVVFNSETASGWQSATFTTPVSVTAGTTYIVSYFAPNGHYSIDRNYFNTNTMTTPYITVPLNTVGNENGVFGYGGSSTFPSSNFNAGNYWVDVEFVPDASAPPSGGNASATSTTAALTESPASKAGSTVSLSGGDGWRPIPYENAIYNIGHHQEATSTYPAIYAIDRSTGQQLSGYPKTLNAGDASMPTDLVTSTHNVEFFDRDGQYGPAGSIYIGVQRLGQSEVGMACFNVITGTGCGYTPMGSTVGNTSGAGGFNAYTAISGAYELNGIFYILTSDGRLVRMNIQTRTALPPVDQSYPDATDVHNSSGPTLYKIGGKLISYIRYTASTNGALHPLGVRMQCYDPATNTVCSGWSSTPLTLSSTVNNTARLVRGTTPMLNSSGQEDGFCTFWLESPTEGAYCYALDGSTRATPAALLAPTDTPNSIFDSVQLPGTTRTYIPYQTQISPTVTSDSYLCFDWATLANCADFGDTPGTLKTWGDVNSGNLATYSIVVDPDVGGCMLALGDRSWMVSFSATTGQAPCRKVQYTAALNPITAYCDGVSRITAWEDLNTQGIDPSLVNSARLSIYDTNGTVLSSFNDIAITPGTPIDISSIPASGVTHTLTTKLTLDLKSNWPWLNGQPSVSASFEGSSLNLEPGSCTLSRIASSVFNDANNNGIRDSGENPLGGGKVALLSDDSITVAVVDVDASGNYEFIDIAPGSYAIQFLPPAGYVASALHVGTGQGTTSDANPDNNLVTRFVALVAGNTGYILGAGFHLPEAAANPPSPGDRLADTSSGLIPALLTVFALFASSIITYLKGRKLLGQPEDSVALLGRK